MSVINASDAADAPLKDQIHSAHQPVAVLPMDEHIRALVANAHPADWRNPRAEGRYNLVVIGGGTAGLVGATGTAGLGGKAELIERHLPGGDCLNFGCVPSKSIIRSAKVIGELDTAGVAYEVLSKSLSEVDRVRTDGETEGFVKVLVKRGTDKILGATIVAEEVGEMLNEITLAMVAGLGLKTLSTVIHPCPTQAEAIKKIADGYNRTRLTPTVKRLFATWLAWARR